MLEKQKTVLITGASSGIGEALAYLFAKNSYALVLTGRDMERLELVARACLTFPGVHVTTIVADLAEPNQSEILFQKIIQKEIHIDVLVNNAGFGEYGSFYDIGNQQILEMIHVNILSLSHLTRLCLPGMKKNCFGMIIFIGSVYSYIPIPKQTLYAATKAFVKSLALGLRSELAGTGVMVSCVCPGSTQTRFHYRAGIHGFSKFFAMTPEQVALCIMKGIKRHKAIIIPGWYNKLFVGLMCLLPSRSSLKLTQWIVYKLRKFSE